MDETKVFSVSELNGLVKELFDRTSLFLNIAVCGELSNYKIYPSGHHYFTLKDSESSLRCVMFKSSAARLRFRPENGMSVTAFGRLSVFPRDGAYQLYCSDLMPEGRGDLQVAFEQLKKKLSEEGLFDEAHKKTLPAYPKKIAIITAYAHDTSIGKLRLDGYRRALADHGIECADSLVVHMPAKGQVYTMKNGYDQTMKLLQSGEKFTAVYAISDTLAIGACKAIFDYGLKVPDDISVVGCDGLDMASYYQPAITTIEQPLTEMALETSRILFELIREKGGRRKHIFEARIREGQSVRRI